MSIFSKLYKIFKGEVNNTSEKIIEANRITLIEQNIRDHEITSRKRKESMSKVMASVMASNKKINNITIEIQRNIEIAQKAKDTNKIDLAKEIMTKTVKPMRVSLALQEQLNVTYKSNETRLRDVLEQGDATIAKLKAGLEQAKTNQITQDAIKDITDTFGSEQGSLVEADNELNKLLQSQDAFEMELDAVAELNSGTELEKKMAALESDNDDDLFNELK